MRHFDDEDLILHIYGESAESDAIEHHLEECVACRAELASLRATLDAADTVAAPERSDAYPREVWARLQEEIDRRRVTGWKAWLAPRRLAPVAGVAILVVVAFLAGQWRGEQATADAIADSIPAEVKERILLAAVGNHLEKSHRLLIELANAGGNGEADVTDHRERARSLANLNRVYRRSAQKSGDPAVAELLGELERILLDVANGPEVLESDDLEDLKERIARRGLLIRVRVLGEKAAEAGRAGPAATVRDRV